MSGNLTSASMDSTRLYSLDALRGIAALAVVVFHYANFMTVRDVLPPSFVRDKLPFHSLAPLAFDKGWLAVDLFFTLSGFVFFWLYVQRISNGSMSPFRFFMLRLSRLYPLHFAMLLVVAVLQWVYASRHPEAPFFLVPVNDAYHFALHLFFISNWLPSFGFTFNSPVWSVSIEMLLYVVFFAFCRYTGMRPLVMAALAVLGWWFIYRFSAFVGRGIGSFFAGGLAYYAFARILKFPSRDRWTYSLIAVSLAVWVIGLYGLSKDWAFVPPWLANRTRYFPVAVMFPVTVLALALVETRTGKGKSLAWLGDISYSIYLIHFPLQLVFVLAADKAGVDRSFFYSPWAFLLFFAALISLSYASYNFFERPAQRWIRSIEKSRAAQMPVANYS